MAVLLLANFHLAIQGETMTSVETKLNEALERVRSLEQENQVLKITIRTNKIVAAHAARQLLLKESKLPVESVSRLNRAFQTSTDNAGLKEAISTEKRYTQGC